MAEAQPSQTIALEKKPALNWTQSACMVLQMEHLPAPICVTFSQTEMVCFETPVMAQAPRRSPGAPRSGRRWRGGGGTWEHPETAFVFHCVIFLTKGQQEIQTLRPKNDMIKRMDLGENKKPLLSDESGVFVGGAFVMITHRQDSNLHVDSY